MWPVDRPAFDTGKIFDDCTGLIRRNELRNRMVAIRQEILDLSDDYDLRAQHQEMHLLASHKTSVGAVRDEDLIKNYTLRMARKGVPARPAYDALKALPKHNRCPYCNFGSVETLDHVLPKTIYPEFSVHPTNLVGCCDRCNKLKDDAYPTSLTDSYIHPYFDSVNHETWLFAEVVETKPAAVIYTVSSTALSRTTVARISRQFSDLELARIYSDAAADEIIDIEDALEEMFISGGDDEVEAHLYQQFRSRRNANRNSWRAALYEALAHSDWYCSGGFRAR